MQCPHCKVDLALGQAIRPHGHGYGNGSPGRCGCFGPHLTVLTIDNLSFQFCGKCPKCGHSDDDVREWADKIVEQVGVQKWIDEYEIQFIRADKTYVPVSQRVGDGRPM